MIRRGGQNQTILDYLLIKSFPDTKPQPTNGLIFLLMQPFLRKVRTG